MKHRKYQEDEWKPEMCVAFSAVLTVFLVAPAPATLFWSCNLDNRTQAHTHGHTCRVHNCFCGSSAPITSYVAVYRACESVSKWCDINSSQLHLLAEHSASSVFVPPSGFPRRRIDTPADVPSYHFSCVLFDYCGFGIIHTFLHRFDGRVSDEKRLYHVLLRFKFVHGRLVCPIRKSTPSLSYADRCEPKDTRSQESYEFRTSNDYFYVRFRCGCRRVMMIPLLTFTTRHRTQPHIFFSGDNNCSMECRNSWNARSHCSGMAEKVAFCVASKRM